MVKLVDTPDLGSGAVRCVGSSPILGIIKGHFPVRGSVLCTLKGFHQFTENFRSFSIRSSEKGNSTFFPLLPRFRVNKPSYVLQ